MNNVNIKALIIVVLVFGFAGYKVFPYAIAEFKGIPMAKTPVVETTKAITYADLKVAAPVVVVAKAAPAAMEEPTVITQTDLYKDMEAYVQRYVQQQKDRKVVKEEPVAKSSLFINGKRMTQAQVKAYKSRGGIQKAMFKSDVEAMLGPGADEHYTKFAHGDTYISYTYTLAIPSRSIASKFMVKYLDFGSFSMVTTVIEL